MVLCVSVWVYMHCGLNPTLSWGHVSRLHYESGYGVSDCSIIKTSAIRTKSNLFMIIPKLITRTRISALWRKRLECPYLCVDNKVEGKSCLLYQVLLRTNTLWEHGKNHPTFWDLFFIWQLTTLCLIFCLIFYLAVISISGYSLLQNYKLVDLHVVCL